MSEMSDDFGDMAQAQAGPNVEHPPARATVTSASGTFHTLEDYETVKGMVENADPADFLEFTAWVCEDDGTVQHQTPFGVVFGITGTHHHGFTRRSVLASLIYGYVERLPPVDAVPPAG